MKTKKDYIEELKAITKEYNFDVENMTQQNDEWFKIKLGVISASHAHDILKTLKSGKPSEAGRTYMLTLISEIMTGKKHPASSQSMDWGNDNEPIARAEYELITGAEIFELPVIFKDENMRCLISPDLISNLGGGEIKCPFNSVNHTKTILHGTIKPEYMSQMQFSMWVTGLESWDFISYDPRYREDKQIHIIKVPRDEDTMKECDEKIPAFIREMDLLLEEMGAKFGDQWRSDEI